MSSLQAPYLSLFFILLAPSVLPAQTQFFVATNGSDSNSGSYDQPFNTLHKAQRAVRELKNEQGLPAKGVEVVIQEGTYFLEKPLVFGPKDSGQAGAPVVYRSAPKAQVVISGGRRVTNWQHENKNRWALYLPQVAKNQKYFRQLFANGRRPTRARLPNKGYYTTDGPMAEYADVFDHPYQFDKASSLRQENPEAFCGFTYKDNDLKNWKDIENAEVITYHSWECSWQTVRRLAPDTRQVFFHSPSRYPVGFFSDHARYRIENVRAALDRPGEWYLNRQSGKLLYLARSDEHPPSMQFTVPVLTQLLVLKGNPKTGQNVSHLKFSGLSFRHVRYRMGFYDVAPNWPAPVLKKHPNWPRSFPPGYTDSQAAPNAGEVISLTNASRITITNCEVTLVGPYALSIGPGSHYVQVTNNYLHNMGAGGVRIGIEIRDIQSADIPKAKAPSHHTIAHNHIVDGGRVHPSAVGIWIAQSHHNQIVHNQVAEFGYSGISLGWTWGRRPNYTHHNTIAANHIHHVLRELADGGGIYSLGVLEHSVYRRNYIHDIARPPGAIGSHNNGLFFDEGSKGLHIEQNVIEDIMNAAVRFNDNRWEDHTWQQNAFEAQKPLEGEPPLSNETRTQIIQEAGPRHAPTPVGH